MNPRQKAYGSYDKTNRLLRLTNSYYHTKNLDLIKYRKPQYGNTKPFNSLHKNKYLEPMKDFFVIRENQIFSNKLHDIKWQPVKPKINTVFLQKEENFKQSMKRYKYLFDLHRTEENDRYKKSLLNQKPFISTKTLDDKFSGYHMKTVQKLRKVPDNDTIVLPSIGTEDKPAKLLKSLRNKKKYGNSSVASSGNRDDTNSRNASHISSGNTSEDKESGDKDGEDKQKDAEEN